MRPLAYAATVCMKLEFLDTVDYHGDAAIAAFWHDKQVPSQAAKEHLSPQGRGLVCRDHIVQMDGWLLHPDGGEEILHLLSECVKEEILHQIHQNNAGEAEALLVEDGPGYQGLVSTV